MMDLLQPASHQTADRAHDGRSHRAATERPLRALVITGSVGAGHNGAAKELVQRLEAHGVQATYRDYLDALPRAYRRVLQDGYAFSASHTPRSSSGSSAARRRTRRSER
jgi:hypothetical protein